MGLRGVGGAIIEMAGRPTESSSERVDVRDCDRDRFEGSRCALLKVVHCLARCVRTAQTSRSGLQEVVVERESDCAVGFNFRVSSQIRLNLVGGDYSYP